MAFTKESNLLGRPAGWYAFFAWCGLATLLACMMWMLGCATGDGTMSPQNSAPTYRSVRAPAEPEHYTRLRGLSAQAVIDEIGEPDQIRRLQFVPPVLQYELPPFDEQWVYVVDAGGYGHLLIYLKDDLVVYTVYEFSDF